MMIRNNLRRYFGYKTILDMSDMRKTLKRRNRKFNLKILASGVLSSILFCYDWYTLSLFGSMAMMTFLISKKSNVLLNKLVLKIEVDDADKSLARCETLKQKFNINIDSVTSLTDIYPAYRSLKKAVELTEKNEKNIASFEGEKNSKEKLFDEYLARIEEDAHGYIGTVESGSIMPYKENADRFGFYFRHGFDLFYIGFPYSTDIEVDCEEIMRVLAGNKVLKPRRSVSLAEQDSIMIEAEQSEIRAKLKGELNTELPNSKREELEEGSVKKETSVN